MAISDAQKVDILWKALQRRAASSTSKAFYEEQNFSVANTLNNQIWTQSGSIPIPAVLTSNAITSYCSSAPLIEDVTVTGQKSWTTPLKDWIHPSVDQSYQVRLYSLGWIEIPPTDNSNWVFDYNSGTLTFYGDNSAHAKPYFIKGWRYVGTKGIPSAVASYTSDFLETAWTSDGPGSDSSSITFQHNLGTTSVQVSVFEDLGNGNLIPTYTDWVVGLNAIRLLITPDAFFAGKVVVKPL